METNLQQHNNELIVRLIWFSISFLSIFLVSYLNQNEVSSLWISNLEDSIWELTQKIPKMQYLSISDGLETWITMHLYWSFLWSFPILVYQSTQFLKPGLTKKEWENFVLLGFCGTIFVLSISGFLFSNFLDDSFLTRTGRRGDLSRSEAHFFYGVSFLLIRVYPYGFCITLSYN